MNLEVKVFALEAKITGLNSKLEDCRQVIQEWAGAFGGGGIADMRRDMEQMSIQIGLLQRAVSNTPVVAHDAGAGFGFLNRRPMVVLVMRRRSRTFFSTWSCTSLPLMLRMRRGRCRLRQCT
ncbi:UNVERIFIED_CONTAM: hypothetical protein Slati_0984300 [Sesamum latifolium]|uniref:Uncharacterized protein n=1 Tax=Sesamum latifolium TaxID=2727402 RepID=A0AAW2XUK3_9LAMI